jgi:hypothetical protein
MAISAQQYPESVCDPVGVALALALARPDRRARYLGRDNAWTGESESIEDATRSGCCFMVTVAQDVLAVDLDTKAEVASATSLAEKLVADERPVLLVPSGRPGHAHLWAVIADPQALSWWKSRAKARGLQPPRSVMRPPGSPHRLGSAISPVEDGVDFLARIQIERYHRDDEVDRSDYWLQTLRTGRHRPRLDKSPSNMAWLIAKGAARAGWTLSQFRDALADPDNAGGESYRQRLSSPEVAEEWIQRYVWSKAVKAAGAPTRRLHPDLRHSELDKIRAAVVRAPWPGKAGTTDRANLEAKLARAEAWNLVAVPMSQRETMETAHIASRDTVRKSDDRLIRAGWLFVKRKGTAGPAVDPESGEFIDGRKATEWGLRIPARFTEMQHVQQTRTTDPFPPVWRGGCTASGSDLRVLEDISRSGGIGQKGMRVLETLARGPMTISEIATELHGEHVTTGRIGGVRRLVSKKLSDLGLVRCEANRWRRVDDFNSALVAAAIKLGLLGRADRVKRQHEEERRDHDEWRDLGSPNRRERGGLTIREWIMAERRWKVPPMADPMTGELLAIHEVNELVYR